MTNKLRITAENSVMKHWWKRYFSLQRCWVIETKTAARQGHFPWIRQSMHLFRTIQTRVSNWLWKGFQCGVFPQTCMQSPLACFLHVIEQV